VLQPAGLYELTEGKVDLLIDRGLGHHPRYRCDPLSGRPGLGDWLIAPVGTANCPEVTSFRAWLQQLPTLVATSDRPPRLQIAMPIRQTRRAPRRLVASRRRAFDPNRKWARILLGIADECSQEERNARNDTNRRCVSSQSTNRTHARLSISVRRPTPESSG
jgi:hypothetical protein